MRKKKMTNVTPEEEEAWQEYERQVDAARRKSYGSLVTDNLKEAKLSAERFVADNTVKELGNISLLMAYELGYRAAMYAAERKKNGQN
jgi:hypothetical protein